MQFRRARFLSTAHCRSVYGQMVIHSSRRQLSLFRRYGFRVIDRTELTKYRALHRGRVLLCTVVKDLTQNQCRARI
jgi:hypothetical protein